MKVVILTQYFPPEVGAPQNKLYELAIRLHKKVIIRNNCGIVVNVMNQGEVTNSTTNMVKDKARMEEYGKNGHKTVIDKCNCEEEKELIKFYNKHFHDINGKR